MLNERNWRRLLSSPFTWAAALMVLIALSIAISSHSFFAFFSIEGLLIVGGGVIVTAFMSYQADAVKEALHAVSRLLKNQKTVEQDLSSDMMAIIYCAKLLKERGMRSLETIVSKSGLTDPFIKYGFNMAVSEYPPEEVRAMLETAAEATYERESIPVEILHSMASHAPAFGMIGTLVGMVAMLSNIGTDMSGVGPSLAVSFLSTLYGVVSARLLYMPAASKLRQEVEDRRFRNYLITEGMTLLVAEKTPMYIQDRLNSYLKPEVRNYVNVLETEKDRSAVPYSSFPTQQAA